MPKVEVEVKNKNNKSSEIKKEMAKNAGPQVRDIKIAANKTADFKKPINSRVIEIKEEKEEKKPRLGLKIAILSIAVFLIACLFALYFFFFSQPYQTLQFIPKETIFYFHADINKISKNKNLNSLIPKFINQNDLQNNITKSLDEKWLSQYEINFENDLKNNLSSEIVYALYYNADKKIISPYLVFKIKDRNKFQETANKIKNAQIKEVNFSSGKIQNLLFENPSLNFSYAVIKNTVIIARDQALIEKSIKAATEKNNIKPKRGITDFKKIAHIYINTNILPPKSANDLLRLLPIKKDLTLYYLALNYQNIYLDIEEEKNGLSFSSSSLSDGKSNENISALTINQFINFIPQETAFAIFGKNLGSNYQNLKNGSRLNKYLDNFEKELSKKYSIKIDELLAAVPDSKFAFAALSKKQNYVLVFKTTDQKESEGKIAKLESLINQYFAMTNPQEKELKLPDETKAIEILPNKKALKIEEKEIEGIKYKELKDEKNKIQINLAQKDGFIILNLGDSIKEILSPDGKMASSRATEGVKGSQNEFSKTFKKSSWQKSNSMLYISVPELLNYLGKDEASKNFWSPLKSFIFTTKNEDGKMTGKGFLLIE